MKKIKRILSDAISLSISLMTMSIGVASSVDTGRDNTRNDMTYLHDTDRKSYSVELFQDFVNNCPSKTIDGTETAIFPENYGGAYIDNQGVLHFKVVADLDVEATSSDVNYYISVLKKSTDVVDENKDIIVEDADVTLEQLLKTQKALDSVMQEYNISSTYTDEENNTLVISLFDTSKKRDILRYLDANVNGFNNESIEFEQSSVITSTATNASNNALAGSASSSSAGYSATLGFNAYNASSGKYGVVTAAHFATSGTTIYNALGYTIGKVKPEAFMLALNAFNRSFYSSVDDKSSFLRWCCIQNLER